MDTVLAVNVATVEEFIRMFPFKLANFIGDFVNFLWNFLPWAAITNRPQRVTDSVWRQSFVDMPYWVSLYVPHKHWLNLSPQNKKMWIFATFETFANALYYCLVLSVVSEVSSTFSFVWTCSPSENGIWICLPCTIYLLWFTEDYASFRQWGEFYSYDVWWLCKSCFITEINISRIMSVQNTSFYFKNSLLL